MGSYVLRESFNGNWNTELGIYEILDKQMFSIIDKKHSRVIVCMPYSGEIPDSLNVMMDAVYLSAELVLSDKIVVVASSSIIRKSNETINKLIIDCHSNITKDQGYIIQKLYDFANEGNVALPNLFQSPDNTDPLYM